MCVPVLSRQGIINEKMVYNYCIRYYTFFLFFSSNIYMKGTNEWYVAFLKLLEFYDLYLVITKKGTGRSHVMSRFSSRKNLIL